MRILFVLGFGLFGCGVALTNTQHSEAETRHREEAPLHHNEQRPTNCPVSSTETSELLERLSQDADPLHSDITPSVLSLAELDFLGACAVLPGLRSTNEQTRLHAQRTLEIILTSRCGFENGVGFPDQHAEEAASNLLGEIAYEYNDNENSRNLAAMRWNNWVESAHQQPACSYSEDPSPTILRTALDLYEPAFRRCDEPLEFVAVFTSEGNVQSVHGNNRSSSYNQCIQDVAESVVVPPFQRETFWVRYHPPSDRPECSDVDPNNVERHLRYIGHANSNEEEHRRAALVSLVQELLVQERAEQRNLIVTDQEERNAIEDIAHRQGYSAEELMEAVQNEGYSIDEYRSYIRLQLLTLRYLGQYTRGAQHPRETLEEARLRLGREVESYVDIGIVRTTNQCTRLRVQ